MSAQIDGSKQSGEISPIEPKEKTTTNTDPEDLFFDRLPTESFPDSSLEQPERQFSMFEDSHLINPKTIYEERWRKKKNIIENESKKRGESTNQFLGVFKTKSANATLRCRDHGSIDGDIVRIFINDTVYESQVTLLHKFKGFKIPLEGINKIEFQALNEGLSSPNTATFAVYNESGALITANEWNLQTGVKATIIILKE